MARHDLTLVAEGRISEGTIPVPVDDGPTPTFPVLRHMQGVLSWVIVLATTIIVLALAAITVGPRFLPYQALVVRSGSMAPTIPTGSVVFYRQIDASRVEVGDVIVFSKPGQADERVTHRVYQIADGDTGRYFVTKGDANGVPDAWRIPAVGKGWIAVFHVPVVGFVLYDLQSTLGRLLLLLVPAILLGIITLYEIWRDEGDGPEGAPG